MPDRLLRTEVLYVYGMKSLGKLVLVTLVGKSFAKMQIESPSGESVEFGASNATVL